VIDQYTFSPEPHTLAITYVCEDGSDNIGGDISFEFEGQVRPGKKDIHLLLRICRM